MGTARRQPDLRSVDCARKPAWLSPLPAHSRLRLPVRLRGDRAGRVQRQRRVDVFAAHGLAQHLRGDARPRRGRLSFRAGGRPGSSRAPLSAGHDGARNQLGHAGRLDHRARRAAHRPLASRSDDRPPASSRADRLRSRAHPAAHRPVRQWRGPAQSGVRAGLRLRPATWPLALYRARLSPGHRLRPTASISS